MVPPASRLPWKPDNHITFKGIRASPERAFASNLLTIRFTCKSRVDTDALQSVGASAINSRSCFCLSFYLRSRLCSCCVQSSAPLRADLQLSSGGQRACFFFFLGGWGGDHLYRICVTQCYLVIAANISFCSDVLLHLGDFS